MKTISFYFYCLIYFYIFSLFVQFTSKASIPKLLKVIKKYLTKQFLNKERLINKSLEKKLMIEFLLSDILNEKQKHTINKLLDKK